MERLSQAKWLGNHGLTLVYKNGTAAREVFVPPTGSVTMVQAEKALDCSHMMLYRMRDRRTLRTRDTKDGIRIKVGELWRIRSAWRAIGRKTEMIPRPTGR